MTKLFFKLYGVPEDEIEEVRELCEVNKLDVYETDMGRWGIGIAAIWLSDNSQYDMAKVLLDEYQQARYQNAQQDRAKIQTLTLLQGLYVKFKQDPNQFALTVAGLAAVLALSLYPFLSF